MALYDEQGFDATTVDQVARRAGISQRTFFRYFPTKEDVVLDTDAALGEDLVAALRARPRDETPWRALGHALRVRTTVWQQDPDHARLTLRLLDGSPELGAGLLRRNLACRRLLEAELEGRLARDRHPQLQASALVGAAFGCLDAAYRAWCERGGDLDRLFDVALDSLESLRSHPSS